MDRSVILGGAFILFVLVGALALVNAPSADVSSSPVQAVSLDGASFESDALPDSSLDFAEGTYFCVRPHSGDVIIQSTACTPDCIFGETDVTTLISQAANEIAATEEAVLINVLRSKYPSTFAFLIKHKALVETPTGSGNYKLASTISALDALKIASISEKEKISLSINKRGIIKTVLNSNLKGQFGSIRLGDIVEDFSYDSSKGGLVLKIDQPQRFRELLTAYNVQKALVNNGRGGIKVSKACKCGTDAYTAEPPSAGQPDRRKTDAGAYCCIVAQKSGQQITSLDAVPSSKDCNAVVGFSERKIEKYLSSKRRNAWFSFKVDPALVSGTASVRVKTADPNGCLKLGDQVDARGRKYDYYDSASGTVNVEFNYDPACKSLEELNLEVELSWTGNQGYKVTLPVKVEKKAQVLFVVKDQEARHKLAAFLTRKGYIHPYKITESAPSDWPQFANVLFPRYGGALSVADIGDEATLVSSLQASGISGGIR